KMFNCLGSHVDRIEFFQECMYFLMAGCGTGFSVQLHHIAKLPKINQRLKGTKTFVVADEIEGWSNAFGVLISSFVDDAYDTPWKEYQGYIINFDLSLVRPE